MYRQTINDITIEVRPAFLEDQSSAQESRFVWAYQVTIRNGGEKSVQLLSRHWRITDAQGRVQEVRGTGVVGKQPVIHPGDFFEYTSGTPLTTPSGIMVGNYEMMDEDGEHFDAPVPAFSLDSPYDRRAVN